MRRGSGAHFLGKPRRSDELTIRNIVENPFMDRHGEFEEKGS
tara:strand:- start:601 stop:726 length:126 start_codon:yes stop_codon:yes gene_type:complete